MTEENWMWLGLGLLVLLMWKRSDSGGSIDAVQQMANQEAATLAALGGTNWTQSIWDSVNGQPGYMFGTVPVPTTDSSAASGNLDVAGIGIGTWP
jgi:hypothetical protein